MCRALIRSNISKILYKKASKWIAVHISRPMESIEDLLKRELTGRDDLSEKKNL